MIKIEIPMSNFTATFKSHDYYLQLAGSSWTLDTFSLYIMSSVGIFGMITNILSFMVLKFGSDFNLNLYYYLKIFLINSSVINSFGTIYAFMNSRRYIPFGNSWFALVYINQLAVPVVNTCYYYNNILDILMLLDKLSIFVKILRIFNQRILRKPVLICIIAGLICVLLNIPIYLLNAPSVKLVYLNTNETYLFYSDHITNFGLSKLGEVLDYIDNVIRDVVPFFLWLY